MDFNNIYSQVPLASIDMFPIEIRDFIAGHPDYAIIVDACKSNLAPYCDEEEFWRNLLYFRHLPDVITDTLAIYKNVSYRKILEMLETKYNVFCLRGESDTFNYIAHASSPDKKDVVGAIIAMTGIAWLSQTKEEGFIDINRDDNPLIIVDKQKQKVNVTPPFYGVVIYSPGNIYTNYQWNKRLFLHALELYSERIKPEWSIIITNSSGRSIRLGYTVLGPLLQVDSVARIFGYTAKISYRQSSD